MLRRLSGTVFLKDIRKGRIYLKYLFNNRVPLVEGKHETASDIQAIINNSLKKRFYRVDERENFISSMKLNCIIPIPESEFEWIKKNERACYWVWINVKKKYDLYWKMHQNRQAPRIFSLASFTINSKEIYDNIIKIFDILLLDRSSANEYNTKLGYLKELKGRWFIIYKKNKPIPWLDIKNEGQCNWAWSYLENELKKIQQNESEFDVPLFQDNGALNQIQISESQGYLGTIVNTYQNFFMPSNHEEQYHSIYAILDAWDCIEEKKTLILQAISKAHSQKKFRDGNKKNNKVALNTYLDKRVKERLNELRQQKNLTIEDMLEKLINKAHKKLINKAHKKT